MWNIVRRKLIFICRRLNNNDLLRLGVLVIFCLFTQLFPPVLGIFGSIWHLLAAAFTAILTLIFALIWMSWLNIWSKK